jgi:hypothetical protein
LKEQLQLRSKENVNETFRQTLELEIAKQITESFARIRKVTRHCGGLSLHPNGRSTICLCAGAVGTPATPRYSLPISGRSSDIPVCYSGQVALRREKCGMSFENQNCEAIASNGSADTLIARQ